MPKGLQARSPEAVLRELMSYNFRVTRHSNSDNRVELRHPFFKKGCFKDLLHVKKGKSSKKISKLNGLTPKAESSDESIAELRAQISKLQNVIDFVIQQNKQLVATNNKLMSQLSMLKSQCDGKMEEVLGMLVTTLASPGNIFSNAFKRLFDELNVRRNCRMDIRSTADGEIDYHEFFNNAVGGGLSIFKLFERLTMAFENCKSRLIRTAADQAVQNLAVVQCIDTDDVSNQANSTDSITHQQSLLPKIHTSPLPVFSNSGAHPFTDRARRRYSKDDITLEELKCADRFLNDVYSAETKETTSLSECFHTPAGPFSRDGI